MIPLLRKFFSFFRGSINRADTLPGEVSDDEPLTRFIFSSKLFPRENMRVKPNAFSVLNGETSVFRVVLLDNIRVWKLGSEEAGNARGAPRARATVIARAVRGMNLEIVSAPARHPRHANIINWPSEKEKQQLVKMELASGSELEFPA